MGNEPESAIAVRRYITDVAKHACDQCTGAAKHRNRNETE